MVDVLKEADKILKELGYDDIVIKHKRRRQRFASAGYMAEHHGKITNTDHPHTIWVWGNEPSLVRIGLAYLISHELGHHEYRKEYEHNIDEDFTPEFKEKEREIIEKMWQLCLDSDEEINDCDET